MEIMNELPGWLWWITAIIAGIITSYIKDIIDFVFSKFSKSVLKRIELSEKRKDEIAQIIKGSEFEKIIYSNSIITEYLKAIICIGLSCLNLALINVNFGLIALKYFKAEVIKTPMNFTILKISLLLITIVLMLFLLQIVSNILYKTSVIRRISKIK